jgi:hypothetical protein
LLQLRRQDLLHRKVLRLMHSWAGHVSGVYRSKRREASNLRAALIATSLKLRYGMRLATQSAKPNSFP